MIGQLWQTSVFFEAIVGKKPQPINGPKPTKIAIPFILQAAHIDGSRAFLPQSIGMCIVAIVYALFLKLKNKDEKCALLQAVSSIYKYSLNNDCHSGSTNNKY